MKDKRILYVASESLPYLPENDVSLMAFESAKEAHRKGIQTRIFMPRYGLINERRHQLHEVIRLSGMNLVVNDFDMPLIIKVASIPKERMQVYFIDNEEYFKRKALFVDENDKLFSDNDERAIFFAKGVVETIKKLNWAPDLIHVHGWMASFLPLYLREYYKDEPLFKDSKIITSIYDRGFEGVLNSETQGKLAFDKLPEESISNLAESTYDNLMESAIKYSDAIIRGSEKLDEKIETYLNQAEKPVLDYYSEDEFVEPYLEFYEKQLS